MQMRAFKGLTVGNHSINGLCIVVKCIKMAVQKNNTTFFFFFFSPQTSLSAENALKPDLQGE